MRLQYKGKKKSIMVSHIAVRELEAVLYGDEFIAQITFTVAK